MLSPFLIFISIIPGVIMNLEEAMDSEFGVKIKGCFGNVIMSDKPEQMLEITKDIYERTVSEIYKIACKCYEFGDGVSCEPNVEFWQYFKPIAEKLSGRERMEAFTCFGMEAAQVYEDEGCQEKEGDEFCDGLDQAVEDLKAFIARKEEEEVCCSQDKPYSEACKKVAQRDAPSFPG